MVKIFFKMSTNFDFNDLEADFLNGSCACLALKFNQLYGYEIFHVFCFDKDDESYENEENGIYHTLVKTGEDKYLDITGVHTASEVISYWYRNKYTTRQMTEIFLIDNEIKFKILKKDKLLITNEDKSHYNFQKTLNQINYVYEGNFNLDDVVSLFSSS